MTKFCQISSISSFKHSLTSLMLSASKWPNFAKFLLFLHSCIPLPLSCYQQASDQILPNFFYFFIHAFPFLSHVISRQVTKFCQISSISSFMPSLTSLMLSVSKRPNFAKFLLFLHSCIPLPLSCYQQASDQILPNFFYFFIQVFPYFSHVISKQVTKFCQISSISSFKHSLTSLMLSVSKRPNFAKFLLFLHSSIPLLLSCYQ